MSRADRFDDLKNRLSKTFDDVVLEWTGAWGFVTVQEAGRSVEIFQPPDGGWYLDFWETNGDPGDAPAEDAPAREGKVETMEEAERLVIGWLKKT